MVNFYQILNIPKYASRSRIKKAHGHLRKEWLSVLKKHPNSRIAAQKLETIAAAYGVLSDKRSRRAYDELLRGGKPQGRYKTSNNGQNRRRRVNQKMTRIPRVRTSFRRQQNSDQRDEESVDKAHRTRRHRRYSKTTGDKEIRLGKPHHRRSQDPNIDHGVPRLRHHHNHQNSRASGLRHRQLKLVPRQDLDHGVRRLRHHHYHRGQLVDNDLVRRRTREQGGQRVVTPDLQNPFSFATANKEREL